MRRALLACWLLATVQLAGRATAEIGVPDEGDLPGGVAPKPRAGRDQPPATVAPATPATPASTNTPAPVVREGPKEGVLRFRNGDQLHGELLVISPSDGVVWRHPEAAAPLRFGIENVVQLTLSGAPPAAPAHQGVAIDLTNGDALRGDLLSLDAERLVLETWYAGTVTVKRVMLRRLTPLLAGDQALFDGLTTLEGWKRSPFNPGAWHLRNGVLTVNGAGGIGREMHLPDRARIEFDLAWQQYPNLQIGLYLKNLEAQFGNNSGNSYWVMIGGNSAYLQRSRNNEFNQLGQVQIPKFARGGKARVAILTDKAQKAITLVIDDKPVKTWIEPQEWRTDGTGMVLFGQGGVRQSVRLSNLVVRRWVGELRDSTAAPAATGDDVVQFANGDHATGAVKSIAGGRMVFASTVSPLEVPLERVVEIQFAAERAERARRLAGDVRALFHDGGSATLALDKLDAQALSGTTENAGHLRLDRRALRELQFQIYDEDRGEEEEWAVSGTQPGIIIQQRGLNIILQ